MISAEITISGAARTTWKLTGVPALIELRHWLDHPYQNLLQLDVVHEAWLE